MKVGLLNELLESITVDTTLENSTKNRSVKHKATLLTERL